MGQCYTLGSEESIFLKIIFFVSEFQFSGRRFDRSTLQFERPLLFVACREKSRHHGKKFRLGDNVRVKVARINAFCSEIDFELIWT
jgi:exoribonuclease R